MKSSLRFVLVLGAILTSQCKERRKGHKGRDEDRHGSGRANDGTEATGMGQQLFRLGMDHNMDGKVTRKELEAWFAREGDTVQSDGVDYFAMLDVNGNGVISPTEADQFMSLLQAANSNPASNFADAGPGGPATAEDIASSMGGDEGEGESDDDRDEL